MAEEKKSSGFVLTKDGKAAIFKQNDGFKLKIKSFALFKDKTNKLRKLIEDSGFDYSVLEDLKYDYFNKSEEFYIKNYGNSNLVTNQRIDDDGQKILSMEVNIFNDKANSNADNDETIYDGIIYYCDSYETNKIDKLSEKQDEKTIYAIQYFYSNKINIKASQDPRITFSIQLRFTQNNYEVIDLDMPLDADNGLRLYNDAQSNKSLRSKTLGTTKSLAVGNNQNEIGSILDLYADDGKNQLRMISVNKDKLDNNTKEIDVLFSDNTFSISGNVNSVSLFSKDNTESTAATAFYGFSNNNDLAKCSGTYVLQNSNENKIINGTTEGSTYLNSNNNESEAAQNVFINSNNIKNVNNDTFINSVNITAKNASNHNTFLNITNGTFDNVSNFVSLGGYNYDFKNASNCVAIGHDLTVKSDGGKNAINDTVIFGCYNNTIKPEDIFVLANGTKDKPNNALKVNNKGEIIINDGENEAIISPTGISFGDKNISFNVIYNIINVQNTYGDWKDEGNNLNDQIDKIAANSITNMTLLIDSDYYEVDKNVPLDKRINNLVVSLYNPFENEVTVEYVYHQKTAMTNPEEKIIKVVEVERNSVLQLMFMETEDYKGFVIVDE